MPTARVFLGSAPDVNYILPFENRGAEVGVTLHHPHGQIYAYPVVPPVPARMHELATEHYAKTGRGVLQALIEAERSDGIRMLYEGAHAVAFVPVCARYPYEVWVAPVQPVQDFTELSNEQRADLARALKTVLLKYDGLWQRPFPYVMAWYQAPTDGKRYPRVASARTVFSAVPHARPAEVSGRYRDRRRLFRDGCAARR